jgi:nucleotide-binding universal stress UspA family protein
MLTDAFVPMLTYPEQAIAEALPPLSSLLENFATHVTYCGVEIDVPDLAGRWGASLVALPQMVAEVESRSRRCAADLLHHASLLESTLHADRLTIRAAFADPGPAIARQARNHDFSAFAVRNQSTDHQTIAESLIFGAGRPLLIVPEQDAYTSSIKRLAIAWDGSATAYKAIVDAMPLIAKSSEVVVLTASDDKKVPQPTTDAMLGYLARHGAEASLKEVVSSKAGIGEDLQRSAMLVNADLLVMGAYGHSRLREFVLGGATADVLRNPMMPIFLSR